MSKLVNKIKTDSIQAMKSKDTAKLSTLRLLIAEFEKEKVAHKLAEVTDLTDEQATSVISRQVKKLDKEIEAYVAVSRTTENQENEKELLIYYLPKQLTEQELLEIIKLVAKETFESSKKIGEAMKSISEKVGASADKGLASKLLREEMKKMEESLKIQK